MKSKIISGFILLFALQLVSCSKQSESKFVKASRELFFGVDFTKNFDDAVTYYQSNPNVVDGKLFEEPSQGRKSDRNFVFQKHPVVNESFKGGNILIAQPGGKDTVAFKESFYFDNAESAAKSFQLIEQKLRPVSEKVVSSDSAGLNMKDYNAAKDDRISGIHAVLVADSATKGSWIHLFVKRD